MNVPSLLTKHRYTTATLRPSKSFNNELPESASKTNIPFHGKAGKRVSVSGPWGLRKQVPRLGCKIFKPYHKWFTIWKIVIHDCFQEGKIILEIIVIWSCAVFQEKWELHKNIPKPICNYSGTGLIMHILLPTMVVAKIFDEISISNYKQTIR